MKHHPGWEPRAHRLLHILNNQRSWGHSGKVEVGSIVGGKGYNKNREEAQTTLGGGRRNAQLHHHQEKSSNDLCPKRLFSGASGKRASEGGYSEARAAQKSLSNPAG